MNKISTSQERLRQIMDEKGLKQVDILNLSKPWQNDLDIKMSKTHLSNYVNGKSTPDNFRLVLLSKVLGVSEAWLMGYDVPRDDEEEESPLIEKTIENMKKLAEERQENVLKFSKMQLDEQKAKEQNDSKAKVIPMKKKSNVLTDEALQEAVDTAVAFDGIPLNEQEKEAAKALIRRFWEEDHPED